MKPSKSVPIFLGLAAVVAASLWVWGAFVRTPTPIQAQPLGAAIVEAAEPKSQAKSPMTPKGVASTISDWPNIFGPTHDSVSTETDVVTEWPKEGPPILWEIKVGSGYSAPAVAGGDLILFHRKKDKEIVERLDADSGKATWSFDYPTEYVDRYGYNDGPRCTPIVTSDRIFTFGAEGKLHCLERATGKKVWDRDLKTDYEVEQGFFGVGASPLLEGDRLIINVGGKTTNAGIVAVEAKTGKSLWKATDQGASYSTPRAATIHGKRYVFVFTEAGLVSVEPASGKVVFSIPFRSRLFESVNASPPVVVDDIVLVSATYGTGSLCVRIKPDGSPEELWRDKESMDSHFSNFVVKDGYLYGFAGRHENGSSLRCVELLTGKVMWARESNLGRGSMVSVGDRLILWGERGSLFALDVDPKEPKLRAATDEGLMRHPCWAPPSLSHGLLYLRSDDALRCYDLRKKA